MRDCPAQGPDTAEKMSHFPGNPPDGSVPKGV